MKIGVVCEGVTDYIAIKHYVGKALHDKGVASDFVALQPTPDNTSGGGWPQVLTWLLANPPASRKPFFERGLFANSSRLSGLDFLLIQLDTDILPEQGFRNFVGSHGYIVGNPVTIFEKGAEVSEILLHFAVISLVEDHLKDRHIAAPIAESSETWCIAVDEEFTGSPEELVGQDLIDAFGAALARFNKQPIRAGYKNINKTAKSRDRYCEGTLQNIHLLGRCALFGALVEKIAP